MCDPSAMQQVLDNLKELPPSTGAKDIDLIFLRGIMESPIVRSLAKVIPNWPELYQFVESKYTYHSLTLMCFISNILLNIFCV